MTFQQIVEQMTDEYGRDVTYRRQITTAYNPATRQPGSTTTTDYQIKAAVRELKENEISGALAYGDRMVKIPGTALPITPKKGDFIIIGSKKYRVHSVDDIIVNGLAIQYRMTAAGDA